MDNADACCLRFRNIIKVDLFTEKLNRACVPLVDTAEHLDQSRLACTIFTHQRIVSSS